MGKILSGKQLSESYFLQLKNIVSSYQHEGNPPGLAMILIGDNYASRVYVNRKKKLSEQLGIVSRIIELPENISFEDTQCEIQKLNNDNSINGILLQLPIPTHIDSYLLLKTISPIKDVDGLHPLNLGELIYKKQNFTPCTPQGCLQLIKSVCPSLEGKNVTIIGRSVLVGRPLSILMTHADASVTLLHSKSKNLENYCKEADILISAVGVPGLVNGKYVKKDSIVIDVGINTVEGKIVGDIDFESVLQKASYLTPVPGGVGPMTVSNLMINTIKAFCLQNGHSIPEFIKSIIFCQD